MTKRHIHAVRSAAAKSAMRSRWGEKRTSAKQISVDAEAATALLRVPERERRAVASGGIMKAVAEYLQG